MKKMLLVQNVRMTPQKPNKKSEEHTVLSVPASILLRLLETEI